MFLEISVTLAILFPALLLAIYRSDKLLDYVIYVFVLNRGIRRLVDWYNGVFNPQSLISLTPLLVAFLLLWVAWQDRRRLDKGQATILKCFAGALIWAGAIGALRSPFAALYAMADYIAGFAVFFHAMVVPIRLGAGARWMRSVGWAAIIASIYGWYQYYTIPPWDAFWVEAVGFVGYLGQLEPTLMTVFSTMHERGPLASYLGFALIAMVVNGAWRPWLTWIGVLLVCSVIFLTMSRTGIILSIIGIVLYVLMNRKASFTRIILPAFAVGSVIFYGLDRLPGAGRVQTRYATLSNMQEDGSYKGRVEIFQGGSGLLANPIGTGLGSTGMGARLSANEGVIGDSGYLELATAFGWPGTALLLYGFYLIWQRMKQRTRFDPGNPFVMLGRSLMLVLLPAMYVGNFISGVSLLWLVLGHALAHPPINRFKSTMPLPGLRRGTPTPVALAKPGLGTRALNSGA